MLGESVVDYLADLSSALDTEADPVAVLRRAAETAVRRVGGADYAGVTLLGPEGATTVTCTDAWVEATDALQYRLGEGPCLDAAGGQAVVRADDLVHDSRWPAFREAAAERRVGSMLSFRLHGRNVPGAALNLYAAEVAPFSPEAEQRGAVLAAYTALALTGAHERGQFRSALDSRDLIGQAKGILMERFRLSPERAFEMLVSTSQHANVKLREVAGELVSTGVLLKAQPRRRGGRAPT